MKKLLVILAALFIGVSVQAQFTKAKLQATGLTCAMCSNAINKSIEKLPFVETVRSDIKNSAFNVSFKTGEEIDIDQLKKAVEDAGFAIGSLKMIGSFDGIEVANDKHIRIGNRNFHFLGIETQVLRGEKEIVMVDRDFISQKQYKKFSQATKMNCVKTGKVELCCDGMVEGDRIYHVTI